MTHLSTNQPDGTPTWIDLGIPDLDAAMRFYAGVFDWTLEVGPAEYGSYTQCLLGGRRVAALVPNPNPDAVAFWWNVYLACSDVQATVEKARSAGAQVGLWQGRDHIGCEVVNEPGALVRNDLVAGDADAVRRFYAAVFGFRLDRNEDLPGLDLTFLRRPDGQEVGGIMGVPGSTTSAWHATFEVADTDATVARAVELGGTVSSPPETMIYGRIATLTDPAGAEFSLVARATSAP